MTKTYTGIKRHRWRVQPFTVWLDGYVEAFTVTKVEAQQRLVQALLVAHPELVDVYPQATRFAQQ